MQERTAVSMKGERVERLQVEIKDLHASRARLVAAADTERRRFEQKLHDEVQQELVALVVNLQLARSLCATDPAAAGVLLEEISKDARAALAGLRGLAFEIYPPLLDAGGLVVMLRSAAADAGIAAQIEAAALPRSRPDLTATVYFCCLEALRNAALHAGDGVHATISVRLEESGLVFEVADDGRGFVKVQSSEGGLRRMSDRVNALGGRFEVESEPGHGTRVRGSLPLMDDTRDRQPPSAR
jgi:signal transduction histidine kinase